MTLKRIVPLLALLALLATLTLQTAAETQPQPRCGSQQGCRVLVMLGKTGEEAKYSQFLELLRSRGYAVRLEYADKRAPALEGSDGRTTDHLVVLAPSAREAGGSVTGKNLESFLARVDGPGNVIVAASHELTDAFRQFALEFGVEFDERGTAVIDHLGYDTSLADKRDRELHTAMLSSSVAPNRNVFSDATLSAAAPVLFRGVGHRLTGRNALAMPLLVAPASAYSYDVSNGAEPLGAPPFMAGSDLALASAVQLRTNARIVFAGSSDMFSDAFWTAKPQPAGAAKALAGTGNRAFVADVAAWAFHERGVLRLASFAVRGVGQSAGARTFRIKDDIDVVTAVSQWDGAKRGWVPFLAQDLQLEAVMLDPYVRKTLQPADATATAQRFHLQFRLPDVHGVYSLKIQYYRHGLTFLEHSETLSVRPFRHDEYDRFITNAYPYYASSFSMMVAFVVFCALWLFNRSGK